MFIHLVQPLDDESDSQAGDATFCSTREHRDVAKKFILSGSFRNLVHQPEKPSILASRGFTRAKHPRPSQ
jgi:hypothetical protein